jgi:hypothetical protein
VQILVICRAIRNAATRNRENVEQSDQIVSTRVFWCILEIEVAKTEIDWKRIIEAIYYEGRIYKK